MAGNLDEHPPSSYLNVGHHAFVSATGSSKPGTIDPRPQSRGRDPAAMAKRASSFGLNILKGRSNRKSTSPEQPVGRNASPRPPTRNAPAPPPIPLGLSNGEVFRGRAPIQPSLHSLANDPMSPLPLPPTIPGARGTSGNRSSSRERPGSSDSGIGTGSRPGTPSSPGGLGSLLRPSTPSDDKKSRRRSFFPGGKLQKKSPEDNDSSNSSVDAFVMKPDGKERYDLNPLLKGQPVPELWDQNGNMFVHLYPNSNASFRLDSSTIASARGLQKLISGASRRAYNPTFTSHVRHMSLGGPLSPSGPRSARSSSVGSAEMPMSPDGEPAEIHLQMPIMVDREDPTPDDITLLVTVRNMFAFLIGQLIVGNHKMQNMFSIFNHIAAMLNKYEFSNLDGSTMGEAAEAAFLGYVADLRLDDVRRSREKTLEALILGERMKCWPLYNEAYVHGVGKWSDIVARKSPLFEMVSPRTRSAMEKSARDLENRLRSLREHLDDFSWPGLFAGFMNSKTVKNTVEVDAWKNAWVGMRKHVMAHYKKEYGNWPPKAKSKKNDFEESGLNRSLLQSVFRDFTDLYDLLVNREDLTERTVDSSHGDTLSDDTNMDHLRKLLSEFDRSLAPVRPPIPYDLPKLPAFGALRRDTSMLDQKKRDKEESKKLKDNDLTLILMDSYNRDGLKSTKFVEAFMTFERTVAHGRSVTELNNIRIGQWIFVCCVLQMLPLLVVDAPGLRWTRGVEYWLCEIPRGNPPWMPERDGAKAYYRVAATGGVVTMPADAVEHGVEGIYRRSHCWVAASKWSGVDPLSLLANTTNVAAPAPSAHPSDTQSRVSSVSGPSMYSGDILAPPSGLNHEGGLHVNGGGGMRNVSRNSFMPGLEALPMPPTMKIDGMNSTQQKRQSIFDPTKSFDAILGTMDQPAPPTKKKGKK